MYKLKFTKLQNEIFRLLCIKAGTSMNKREIAGMLRVSPTAVSKALKGLEKEDLAEADKTGRANLYSVSLNRDNPKAVALKRVENLKMIAESGLSEFLEDAFPGCTVILFGSYSLGEDTEGSDIDVAVIGSKEKDTDLERFEKMLERKIILHYYKSLEKVGTNLRNNILNGITLQGSVEL